MDDEDHDFHRLAQIDAITARDMIHARPASSVSQYSDEPDDSSEELPEGFDAEAPEDEAPEEVLEEETEDVHAKGEDE